MHEPGVVGVVVGERENQVLCSPSGGELDSRALLAGARAQGELPLAPGDREEVALLERQGGLLAELSPPYRLARRLTMCW
jgi:hypothetical protein